MVAAVSSYLIKNGTVITLDPRLGVIENCDVLIEGEAITKIEKNIVHESASVIDATDSIVSPGFVDTHRHVWQTQLRGIANDWSLFDYFVHIRNIYASFYEAEDVYLGNYIGALEALNAGVTTIVDHCHITNSPAHADAAVRALQDSGIRATWCYGFWPNPDYSKKDPFSSEPEWRLEDAKRVKKEFFTDSDEDLLRFGLAPTEVAATPMDIFLDQVRYGRDLGAKIITMHVAKGFYDHSEFHVTKIQEQNMLGPDLLLSHGSAFTDDELKMIKAAQVKISSTPETELQMGMGYPVCFRAEKSGCLASLGVDIVSNNSGDMFNQMRLALQAERSRENERLASQGRVPVEVHPGTAEVLRLATMGGAECIGLSHLIGSLTPGKKADVVVTRCDDISMVPMLNPVMGLVQYASSQNVDTVFVNGRMVKFNKKLLGVDWPDLRQKLRKSAEEIQKRGSVIDKEPLRKRAAKLGYHQQSRQD